MDLILTADQLAMVQQMLIDRWQNGQVGEGAQMRAWLGLVEQLSDWAGARLPDAMSEFACELQEMVELEDRQS